MLDVELAIRFLKKRSGLLLRGTALAAWSGVALATMALVITLALMAGYRQAIANALQQGNAHMIAFAPAGLERDEAEAAAERLRGQAGVVRSEPVVYLPALSGPAGNSVLAEPVVVKAVAAPPSFISLADWPSGAVPAAAVGSGLARRLGLEPGDRLGVRFPPSPGSLVLPAMTFEVVETFSLSFSEFDNRWIITSIDSVMAGVPGVRASGVELMLDDPLAVGTVRDRFEADSPDLVFSDWRDMNRSMFAALKWQTLSLFVVLSLVVAVASFQVSSALVVLAIDKRKTAGMLKAMGATRWRIWRILTLAGLILGVTGVALGLVLGIVLSVVMTSFRVLQLPESLAAIYMIDHVSFVIRPIHLGAIVAVCGLLILCASAWPAFLQARKDPVSGLRAV